MSGGISSQRGCSGFGKGCPGNGESPALVVFQMCRCGTKEWGTVGQVGGWIQ